MPEIDTSHDHPRRHYCRAVAVGGPKWAWAEAEVTDAELRYAYFPQIVRAQVEARARELLVLKLIGTLNSAPSPWDAAPEHIRRGGKLDVCYTWRMSQDEEGGDANAG